MSGPIATNPLDELDGLQAAITAATAGVIARAVTVRNRDPDGFWPGPWPLIQLRDLDYNLGRISGGSTGTKGQEGRAQNYYSIEIQDVIDLRDPGTERVAASQTDLLLLERAIIAWFDHLSNQSLPVEGIATCYRAGEYIRFRASRPFASADGGETRVVKAGAISVIGLPRQGSVT